MIVKGQAFLVQFFKENEPKCWMNQINKNNPQKREKL